MTKHQVNSEKIIQGIKNYIRVTPQLPIKPKMKNETKS